MRIEIEPYSYRMDLTVPDFPDDQPLIVFDGVCILCSWSVQFVLRHDRRQTFRFVIGQSPLGQSLYRHYRLDPAELETILVIVHGRAYAKLDAFAEVMKHLPLPWPLFAVARVVPQPLADWFYDRVARNRYRTFGRTDQCIVPSPSLKSRILG